jgi:ubiquitin-like-conjugating enzyme ATG10
MSPNIKLSAFPYLSEEEFREGITALEKRWEKHMKDQREWTSVDVLQKHDTTYLQITKPLHVKSSTSLFSKPDVKAEAEEVDIEEPDDEVPLPFFPYPFFLNLMVC